MKTKRKKLMVIIIGVMSIALILNAIFTWGITFDHDGGFEWSTRSVFKNIVNDGYTQVRLGENLNNPIFFIPLVFYVYGIEPPPYVIKLEIDDETETLDKIFIESISIEYINGQKINHNINWERKFKSDFIRRFIDEKLVNIPAKRLFDKLPVTVDRRQSCKIRFVGYFVNIEGDKIPFDTTENFEYETPSWRVYPANSSF